MDKPCIKFGVNCKEGEYGIFEHREALYCLQAIASLNRQGVMPSKATLMQLEPGHERAKYLCLLEMQRDGWLTYHSVAGADYGGMVLTPDGQQMAELARQMLLLIRQHQTPEKLGFDGFASSLGDFVPSKA